MLRARWRENRTIFQHAQRPPDERPRCCARTTSCSTPARSDEAPGPVVRGPFAPALHGLATGALAQRVARCETTHNIRKQQQRLNRTVLQLSGATNDYNDNTGVESDTVAATDVITVFARAICRIGTFWRRRAQMTSSAGELDQLDKANF
ncbi:unnamed protein product [Trichogramma brassicae]|uniref:Uncharacterized protein n=1 Tax=Trichogramma brassicae TaxID=86971 RepID=A0A6H5HV16_9HYME|nr:unnamed protein product [Trichogramma brassicae]